MQGKDVLEITGLELVSFYLKEGKETNAQNIFLPSIILKQDGGNGKGNFFINVLNCFF